MIRSITDKTFHQEVDKGIVLVEFWAEWCSYCKMLEPVLEDLAQEYSSDIQIKKINVETNEATPAKFNVMSLPTMILFENGEAKEKIVGYYPKQVLKDYIEETIQK
ncbi:thioredoxin [Enterococcus termitis]|nr:thioredoxin [Enterococcus termitis]